MKLTAKHNDFGPTLIRTGGKSELLAQAELLIEFALCAAELESLDEGLTIEGELRRISKELNQVGRYDGYGIQLSIV